MDIQAVFPKTLTIGSWPVSDTVVYTWIVVAIVATLGLLAFRRFRVWRPRRWQLLIEVLWDYVEELVINSGGQPQHDMVAYLVTMIFFVGLANLLGLVPVFKSPTRDLNTTLALSLVSLASSHYFAARKNGLLGALRRFVEPSFLLLPLTLLGEFSRVLSMALRLFGNVLAGEIVGAVMFMLVPLIAPLPLNALGAITGVLQALVFTTLTVVFMLDAMGSDEPTT